MQNKENKIELEIFYPLFYLFCPLISNKLFEKDYILKIPSLNKIIGMKLSQCPKSEFSDN